MIRTRFAPSPTGYLHIGGSRTCLFNWLFARANQGKFILRIEDTDAVRSKQEFLDEILESIKWLGMDWDEIYFQSQRFPIYLEFAEELIKEDKACRSEDGKAIILKMPQKVVDIDDLVHGKIQFDTSTIKDQVLIKSDQTPTYNFACVIDDTQLEISHVIRGDDHISNTPKQIVIYEALGFPLPQFAHIPMILSNEGGRLSKRTGATSIREFRQMGFLPEAIVNYLTLLGWSPKDNREIISKQDTTKLFSIKEVNPTAAIFNMDKLKWINGSYLRSMNQDELLNQLAHLLKENNYIKEDNFDRKWILDLIQLFRERIVTLNEFVEKSKFFFTDEIEFEADAKEKLLAKDLGKEMKTLSERFAGQKNFEVNDVEKTFRELISELNIKSKELIHPLRAAVTGSLVGPGLFESIALLGREKACKRITRAAELIGSHYRKGKV